MMFEGEDRPMEEDGELQKAYCRMLRDEIDWREVRKEKKEFINRNFVPAEFLLRPRHVLAPVFAVSLAFAAGLFLFPEKVRTPGPDPLAQSMTAGLEQPSAAVLQANAVKPVAAPKSVMIESLSSDMGTPMVFDQTQENVSLVVIWIFPSGKG